MKKRLSDFFFFAVDSLVRKAHDACLQSNDHGLSAILGLQFLHNARDVGLHSFLGDVQISGHLSVVAATCNRLKNLRFSNG